MADSNVELLKQAFTAIQKKNDKEKVDNSINVKPAKVIGIDEDTYKVFAYFIDDTEQNAYTFYNKSGEVLSEGDNVRIYYTTNPAKGWIGAKCGEPNIKIYGGEGVGRKSEWDETSEYFNCYEGNGRNIAGDKNKTWAMYATARGYKTKATGKCSTSEGEETMASNYCSHAEGYDTTSSGAQSHAEGNATKSIGANSHSEGYYTTATGEQSHAEGNTSTSLGSNSHAEGFNSSASGSSSHSEGQQTIASGYCSHSEGGYSKATAEATHAEGSYTKASGAYSHAEGNHCEATEDSCHAEGSYTKASGAYSHAEGGYCESTAWSSHAGGYNTKAKDNISFAHGYYVTVETGNYNNYGKAAFGQYNNYSDPNLIFMIGNGTSEDNRKNAFAVDKNGYIYCSGIKESGGSSSSLFVPYTIADADTAFDEIML